MTDDGSKQQDSFLQQFTFIKNDLFDRSVNYGLQNLHSTSYAHIVLTRERESAPELLNWTKLERIGD